MFFFKAILSYFSPSLTNNNLNLKLFLGYIAILYFSFFSVGKLFSPFPILIRRYFKTDYLINLFSQYLKIQSSNCKHHTD